VQFRSACTAVSVAGITIFTTFPLQPTKCNFLRYVCGRWGTREGRGGGKREEERGRGRSVESIVVGMEPPRSVGR